MGTSVREHAVERATTEKLATLLNDIAAAGRRVTHIQFTGGRDWAVVSDRLVDAPTFSNHIDRWSECEVGLPPHHAGEEFEGETFRHVAHDIVVGAYATTGRAIDPDGGVTPLAHHWSGWIEDAQATWIVFLDGLGRPAIFFPRRDSDGGVIGDGINLQQKGN